MQMKNYINMRPCAICPQSIILSNHMLEMTSFHPLIKYSSVQNCATYSAQDLWTYCTASLDYIRWIFKLDFCTPKYIITRELGIEKLRIVWELRVRKFEEKIREMEEKRCVGGKNKKKVGRICTE